MNNRQGEIDALLEDLELARLANGGKEFRKDWCQCDPDQYCAMVPCQYCAINSFLTRVERYLRETAELEREREQKR